MSPRPVRVVIPICIEPDEHGFHGYAPALKGCHVGGDTIPETRRNLQDAVYLYLSSLIERNEPLPIGCELEYPTPADRPQPVVSDPLWSDIDGAIQCPIHEQAELSIPIAS